MTAPAGRRVTRLALGVEVVDAVRGLPADVRTVSETVPRPYRIPAPDRSPSARGIEDPAIGLPPVHGFRPGRFAITFGERSEAPTPEGAAAEPVRPPAVLRIVDPTRRFVPRRLEVPFATLADVLAAEAASAVEPFPPVPSRGRRVVVFPGAGLHPHSRATGVRGRVLRADGSPARWVRVRARHGTRDDLLGVAHGDDRGEFLLLLAPVATLARPEDVAFPVRVDVTAHPDPVRSSPSDVGDPELDVGDPLADLPIETLPDPAPGAADPVSDGTADPPGYDLRATATVTCRLGRLTAPTDPIRLGA